MSYWVLRPEDTSSDETTSRGKPRLKHTRVLAGELRLLFLFPYKWLSDFPRERCWGLSNYPLLCQFKHFWIILPSVRNQSLFPWKQKQQPLSTHLHLLRLLRTRPRPNADAKCPRADGISPARRWNTLPLPLLRGTTWTSFRKHRFTVHYGPVGILLQ